VQADPVWTCLQCILRANLFRLLLLLARCRRSSASS